MSRKDSRGMFAAVLGNLDKEAKEEQSTPRSPSPHLMKVAAGVRQMQERSELAEKLLKEGATVVEFDPEIIEPSIIRDRFDNAYDDAAIAEIAQSMQERGQIVPGLVRPIPGQPDRFQIVYGRRRLAAAKRLGIKFKAAVRELSDEEAIIFQGEENTAREDLSFIEKCMFALAQEEAGYKRDTICASLSTGKSHVSEMIKIASSVPQKVLFAIGKAPGIGRGRWEDFARRWQLPGAVQQVEHIIESPGFAVAASDDRFLAVFAALPEISQKPAKIIPKNLSHTRRWHAMDRAVSVQVRRTDTKATIALEAENGPRFAEFIADRLDVLYEEFKSSERARSTAEK